MIAVQTITLLTLLQFFRTKENLTSVALDNTHKGISVVFFEVSRKKIFNNGKKIIFGKRELV
jgi:hypothetical protein